MAPQWLMENLVIAKQAADLHTDYFAQRVLFDYLQHNDLDRHIETITRVYGGQRDAMLAAIHRHLPAAVEYTEPDGGMFLWLTLPDRVSSMRLFEIAIRARVAFVPGHPFYIGRSWSDTLRLNFSCVDEAAIDTGVSRLAAALDRLGAQDPAVASG